jgi:hypothetical protein
MAYYLLIKLEKNRKARDLLNLYLKYLAIKTLIAWQTYVSPYLIAKPAIVFDRADSGSKCYSLVLI